MPPRIGIVGAGRTRNGLGPFLARFLEQAGCRVHAVSGRDLVSAGRAAEALAASLGHPVAAAADAPALAAAVDALVVCSPAEHHLDGLRAALAAGIPCLCEKPLVAPAQGEAGLGVVAGFRDRGLLLQENCQWPFVLPVLRQLFAPAQLQPPRTLELGLSPAQPGPAMLADSLSHLLSLAEAWTPLADGPAEGIAVDDPGWSAAANAVHCRLPTAAGPPLQATLRLTRCVQQPRPAHVVLNGCRSDRVIGPDYAIRFTASNREIAAADPLQQLVYGFAANLQAPRRERTEAEARLVARRLRLYSGICAVAAPGGGA